MAERGNRGGRRERNAEGEAAFRKAVDDAKERYNITDIVGRTRSVRRAGRAHVALCAFHQERSPSMHLYDSQGRYHCFGCGADGDIIEYVMRTERQGFVDALRWLGAANLPAVDPAQRAVAAAEDEAERREAIAEARSIWDAARPARGTPAEAYARSRGIIAELPPSIRFARTYAWRDRETGEIGPSHAALIGGVVDAAGALIGLQRVFITDDGKAKLWGKRSKRSLGRVRGGALRLGPPAAEVILCEGPEDGLTLMQELPGRSVWVALGTDMMPAIELPLPITKVTLAGDNDAAGQAAIERAGVALEARGYSVGTMFPRRGFKDFNDQLRGIRQ
ncbi:DNA primase [Sphingomonas histidinilytica]|jgi:DNA primase|uniref:CHC2 zinc finger domain-containing protein n=1 Tax=Rhizorhabdus histidinilytica TaxID=439228 RepID=UPI001ADAB5D9|nr:CHC2 zinc finger domain-containing protein [Rhizorhabdus histidinilytica]MBO9380264.1 DNA primase [Rhizorhabdus histidinilytica]